MAQETSTPVKDKNYNLITALQDSLRNVGRMETYIADAKQQSDSELAEWFSKIQYNNQKAADQAKAMLAKRLDKEGS